MEYDNIGQRKEDERLKSGKVVRLDIIRALWVLDRLRLVELLKGCFISYLISYSLLPLILGLALEAIFLQALQHNNPGSC